MEERTCSVAECDAEPVARGFCGPHYRKARRAGMDVLPGSQVPRHKLSDVDEEARTGTCAVCGPVGIRVRTGRRGRYECETKGRKRSGRYDPERQRRVKYGLSDAEMARIVKAAAGRCAICDTSIEQESHVDHCHKTGAVRGLLCPRCNWGLGWFDDDPARLIAAHIYLLAHGKVAS